MLEQAAGTPCLLENSFQLELQASLYYRTCRLFSIASYVDRN